MGWPKKIEGYPQEFGVIIERAVELKTSVIITHSSKGKATNERFRWYAFFRILRETKHPLAALLKDVVLQVDEANLIIAVTGGIQLKSSENVYARTAAKLEEYAQAEIDPSVPTP